MDDHICKPRSQWVGELAEHDYRRELGEEGDNGFRHETWVCAYCGHVDQELTPEEAEEHFIKECLDAGDIGLEDLSDDMQERVMEGRSDV